MSIAGYMSLFMPTWHPVREADMPSINLPPDLAAELPPEMVKLEHRTQVGTTSWACLWSWVSELRFEVTL